jgi:hypothetical protein
MTHSVEIFLAAHQAIAAGVHMIPRSANDKAYFPQDWFADRVGSLGLPLYPQGRNSYPDFWIGEDSQPPCEGYEIKALAFSNGRPAPDPGADHLRNSPDELLRPPGRQDQADHPGESATGCRTGPAFPGLRASLSDGGRPQNRDAWTGMPLACGATMR